MNRRPSPRQTVIPKRRALVVHGNARVQTELCTLLAAAQPGWELGQAADARQSLAKLHRARWDLVLVDLWLPDTAGWGLCGHIRATWSQTAVLVIGDPDGSLYVKASQFAGAAGYVCRRQLPRQLASVLQSIL